LRKHLKNARECYDGRQLQKMIEYSRNGKVINSEEILMKWLNSYEYHSDADKRAEIDELCICLNTSTFFFCIMLRGKAEAIHNIRKVILFIISQFPTTTPLQK
ncbi:MAG: hypothetical protein ABI876_08610, partial [Bacteroidota bacterium]